MLIKIANDFEIMSKDVLCIVSLEEKDNKINSSIISSCKNVIRLSKKPSLSMIIVKEKNKEAKIYLSPFSVSAIKKRSATISLDRLNYLH